MLCLVCYKFYLHIWGMGKRKFNPLCNYLLHCLIDDKVHFDFDFDFERVQDVDGLRIEAPQSFFSGSVDSLRSRLPDLNDLN